MSTKSIRLLYLILICIDLLKHGAIIALGPAPICWDAEQYLEFGHSVAKGDCLLMGHDVDYRMPGYGWFLGVFLYLCGAYALWGVVVFQHLLSMATALITAGLCTQVAQNRIAGLIAYALSMACLSRDWFANTLLNETLFLFLLTLFWWTWQDYLKYPTVRRALLVGVTLGLSVLVRPIVQLLWIPVVFTFLSNTLVTKGDWRILNSCQHAAVVVATFLLFASPWCVRNWSLYGEPFLARLPAENKWQVCFQKGASANLPIPQTRDGEELFRLLNSCRHDRSETYCYCITDSLKKCGLNRHEINHLVTRLCWTAIQQHPNEFTLAWLKRCVNFWRCRRNAFPHWAEGQPSYHHTMHVWYFEPVAKPMEQMLRSAPSTNLRYNELSILFVGVGLLGLLLRRETFMFGIGLGLAFAYFTLVTSAVEIENYRYRMVLEPAMIVAVVCGLLPAIPKPRALAPVGAA